MDAHLEYPMLKYCQSNLLVSWFTNNSQLSSSQYFQTINDSPDIQRPCLIGYFVLQTLDVVKISRFVWNKTSITTSFRVLFNGLRKQSMSSEWVFRRYGYKDMEFVQKSYSRFECVCITYQKTSSWQVILLLQM